MIKCCLFDLDETLLQYSSSYSREEFFEALFRSLAGYFSQWVHPDQFIPVLMKAIEAMNENKGGSLSNLDVFSTTFLSLVDFPADKFEQYFIDYWQTDANNLEHFTDPSAYPRDIMDWLFNNDFEVVIATGLQAPLVAAELRLKWAGIPVTDYDYKFIAAWDNMHASKPHVEYYQEILNHIERRSDECLFIGDDWDLEIVPASELGIRGYLIAAPDTRMPEDLEHLSGYGQLPQLYEWITNIIM